VTTGSSKPGDGAWKRLRQAQATRARSVRATLLEGVLPHCDAARRFWSRRTWSELAAVPAVSQVVLALVREGASLDTIASYSAIVQDEARHAELSRALAERLGGYDDDVPDGLDYEPARLAEPSDVPFAVWALANGCFSETVSLELIRARHAATRQPIVRAVLTETLKDEALHVRAAWLAAGEVLPNLSRADRRDLATYGQALAEMLRRTFGTRGLSPKLRRQEATLRDEAAAADLGAIPATQENGIVEDTLELIVRRLRDLGVSRHA
jgi:hypothetical protein